jgi:hypothetical protein
MAALVALLVIPSTALAAPKKAQIRFTTTAQSVTENAGTFNLVVQRSGNTQTTVSANLSIAGGTTAVAGTDYSFTNPGTITFSPGQASKSFPVTIIDNGTANAPNKRIIFTLSGASPGGTQLKNSPTTLTIVDDEGPGQLDFSSNSYTVLESGGFATVTVNRTGASNLGVSVQYATAAASTNPATPTADYTPISTPQTLTFAPGEMSKTFQVAITNDALGESAENFNVVLSNPQNLSGGAAPTLGGNTPATVTINDDDVSTYSFAQTLFSVGESDGTATITVNRAGATNLAGSIGYSTSNGTATSGADYTSASGTLNFAAGQTSKTFTVTILPDTLDEPNETVHLALANGATADLMIVDDDLPNTSGQFSDTSYRVNEADGSATITVQLAQALDVPTTVDYATGDPADTATAGSDYTSTSGTLTFPAGVTSQTFQIPILNPATPDPEDDETVTVKLSNPGTKLLLGSPSTATLTIVDDDPAGALDFKNLSYSASETGGLATVTVERVGGSGGDVSVDYTTSDGTATAGSDYTATSGTLTWNSGDASDKTFTVPVTWDGRGEGTESINLALSNAVGADLGPNTAAVVNIADDGASGSPRFTASSYSVDESAGQVTVTVTRSGGSLGGPVSVDYATGDGTAIAGSDYTATSGTLTFGPGEDSKSFTVSIANDSAHEDSETFQATLSNVTGGASIGSPSGATVTIADDDPAPVTPTPPTPPTTPGGPQTTPDQPQTTPTTPQTTPTNPDSTAPAKDTRAPKVTLTAKKIQKALKAKLLTLVAKCDESCKFSVVAQTKSGKKALTLGKATAKGAAGKKVMIKVKLSKKALAQLTRAMKKGKAKVTLSVVAADGAGNKGKAARAVTARS